jgi:hypothetical protein
MIEVTNDVIVSSSMERHFKVAINGKEVYVSKWHKQDEFDTEGDIEIFKGAELLTEDEQEEVISFVENL